MRRHSTGIPTASDKTCDLAYDFCKRLIWWTCEDFLRTLLFEVGRGLWESHVEKPAHCHDSLVIPCAFSLCRDTSKDSKMYQLFRLLLMYHEPQLCNFLDTRKIFPDAYTSVWVSSESVCGLESGSLDSTMILDWWRNGWLIGFFWANTGLGEMEWGILNKSTPCLRNMTECTLQTQRTGFLGKEVCIWVNVTGVFWKRGCLIF